MPDVTTAGTERATGVPTTAPPTAPAPGLKDPRRTARLECIVMRMCNAPGQSIPQISANAAEAKAAYRFLGF